MKKAGLIIIILFAVIAQAFTGVNIKNGNFYISYTDIKFLTEGGFDFEITRTYNSKSIHNSMFGFGWGMEYDTYITIMPDGYIVVHEHGGGGTTRFSPAIIDESLTEDLLDQILEGAIANEYVKNNPNEILEYRNKLKNNFEYRLSIYKKLLNAEAIIPFTDFPEGFEWSSSERGNQKIIRTGDNFRRISDSEKEDFNDKGQLVQLQRSNGFIQNLSYGPEGHLARIENNDGSYVLFKTNEKGQIIEISNGEKSATFKYEDDNLIYSNDAAGNEYHFSYDDVHNMTQIKYEEEGRYKVIEYYPETYFTKSVTDKYANEAINEITEYEYVSFYDEDGSVNSDHYATYVIKNNSYGQKVKNYYEYKIGVGQSGNRYTQMIITDINGVKTTTWYDELCGTPIRIERGNNITTFQYNNKCLLTNKENGYETIKIKYHEALDKIIEYVTNDQQLNYEYDNNGNLIHAYSGDGDWVKLIYDENNLITNMLQEGQNLTFEYNEKRKPIKMVLNNKASIDVVYDSYGEIKSVTSEDGHNIALQVTQAFQNMLSLVKPSGANLGM